MLQHGCLHALWLLVLAEALVPGAQVEVQIRTFHFRVQALSEALLRIERPTASGAWEDRATFLIRGRDWEGVPLKQRRNPGAITLFTGKVAVEFRAARDDVTVSVFIAGNKTAAWEASSQIDLHLDNAARLPSPSELPHVWGLADTHRFVPPTWGPTPPTQSWVPFPETSGFDVNHAAPDVYLFFPGVAPSYKAFRRDVLQLLGPIKPVPNYVFGSWFLWYHNYTQQEKMAEVEEFWSRGYPLDVSGLDMDWRDHACYPNSLTPDCTKYSHDDEAQYLLNTQLFPDFGQFADFLHARNISLFLNDHPMMVNASYTEMSSIEIHFRWEGLTEMLQKGIDFWWFDCHWNSKLNSTDGVYYVPWEKYVQWQVVDRYNKEHRPGVKTMQLGCSPSKIKASSHWEDHQYPTWWTGDIYFNTLGQAVKDMVDGGTQLRPYVHPDCAGHHGPDWPSRDASIQYPGEIFARWVQFCSMGTILRLHSDPNRARLPWIYGDPAADTARSFMRMRLALTPTLIAAGARATMDGTPIVQRLDLVFGGHPEAMASDQYLLGDDLLVAPIDPWANKTDGKSPEAYRNYTEAGCYTISDRSQCCSYMDKRRKYLGQPCMPAAKGSRFSSGNVCEPSCWVEGKCSNLTRSTSDLKVASSCFNRERSVWVPPGQWEDAWTGKVFTGPSTMSVYSANHQMPIYHRRPGLLLTADSSVANIGAQDRHRLVIEAFPAPGDTALIERQWHVDSVEAPELRATVKTEQGTVSVEVHCAESECSKRFWLVRVHLMPHQDVSHARIDGAAVPVGRKASDAARKLEPALKSGRMAPALQGTSGAMPAPSSGPVVELELSGNNRHSVQVCTITK